MSTIGTEKHCRLCLMLMKGGTKASHRLFLNRVEELSPTGHKPFPWSTEDFLRSKKKDIQQSSITKEKFNLLFPRKGLIDLSKWDLSLFCYVLTMYCDLEQMPRLAVEKLRRIRNELCHVSEPNIDDDTYVDYFETIKLCIVRILDNDHKTRAEIEKILDRIHQEPLSLGDTLNQMHIFYSMERDVEERLSEVCKRLDQMDSKLQPGYFSARHIARINVSMPEVEFTISLRNLSKTKDARISNVLSQLFEEAIRADDNQPRPQDGLFVTLRETVYRIYRQFLERGWRIISTRDKCVQLHISCNTFSSLASLFREFATGSINIHLHELRDALSKTEDGENVEVDAVIYKDELWEAIDKAMEEVLSEDNDVDPAQKETKQPRDGDITHTMSIVTRRETEEEKELYVREVERELPGGGDMTYTIPEIAMSETDKETELSVGEVESELPVNGDTPHTFSVKARRETVTEKKLFVREVKGELPGDGDTISSIAIIARRETDEDKELSDRAAESELLGNGDTTHKMSEIARRETEELKDQSGRQVESELQSFMTLIETEIGNNMQHVSVQTSYAVKQGCTGYTLPTPNEDENIHNTQQSGTYGPLHEKDISTVMSEPFSKTSIEPLPDCDLKEESLNTKPVKSIVAAIDFGTTYSGYAYSFTHEMKRDPLEIYTNKNWTDGDGSSTLKTPTVVLFDKDGKFDSFGYDAEDKYAQLSEDEENCGWQYFRRFKMKLNEESVNRGMMLLDDQGNEMSALTVFSASIKYLKDHLMSRLQDSWSDLQPTDVHWVLTVPAIWHDGAKQFMKEAAEKAGIPSDQLTLALEPEAAAIYCKEQAVSTARELQKEVKLQPFSPGAQFMVIDLGGGTVDITVHEIQKDGSLKELNNPSGGPWGGTMVDKGMDKFLDDLFGEVIMKEFRSEFKTDDLEIQRKIEVKKKNCINRQENDKIIINLPNELFKFYKRKSKNNFESDLLKGQFGSSVIKKKGKLYIENDIFLNMFKFSKDNVVNHVEKLLRTPELRDVKTIMMVGGFSESEIMKNAVKDAFPNKQLIIPVGPGLAVVKGAVMYGHNPDAISSRKLPYTYGISVSVPFDKKCHPISKRVYRNGRKRCEDIFKIFVKAGTSVVPHKTAVQHHFSVPTIRASKVTVQIFRSQSENPMFVTDDGCYRIGKISIEGVGRQREEKQMLDVKMLFGDTELHVEMKEHGTNEKASDTFNFLK